MKEFLSKEGVSYQEKNVELDRQAAQEMVSRTGQMGVPVTVMAGQAIIGFDQPALRTAVSRLRSSAQNGAVSKLKLGAQVGDAQKLLSQQGKPVRAGGLIGQVQPGSLAARAGLREGDVIVSVAGQPVNNPDDLAKSLQEISRRKLQNPDLTFWRDGSEMNTRLPVQFE